MEKFNLIIGVLIIVLLIGIFIIKQTPITPDTTSTLYCMNDNDCVPAQCCHPTSCINIKYGPDCKGIACTLNCEPNTMDCGCGYCSCVNNECQTVWTRLDNWC